MRSGRMKVLLLIGIVVLAALAVTAVAWGRAEVAGQSNFQSNGALISGWHWLRSSGNTATWTFNTASFRNAKNVYINFNPLVTNGVNGGSGYSSNATLTVTGNGTKTFSVPLTNPFRPTDPQNSSGIGYQAYGHSSSSIPVKLRDTSTLTVTAKYPFSGGCHVAVNRDCMVIGYSK